MNLARSPVALLKRTATRIRARADKRSSVHFLHIGKTGGSTIRAMVKRINETTEALRLVRQGHWVTLRDLPEADQYFFAVRDPLTRSRSGFYSRKREGRPHYHVPWTPGEELAFTEFEHAADLAEALYDEGDRGERARAAIFSISHCARLQIEWFKPFGAFLETRPPLWILRQEHLAKDWGRLLHRLDLDPDEFALDETKRIHTNNYGGVPPMSDRATENLRSWYRHDLLFYQSCERWLDQQTS